MVDTGPTNFKPLQLNGCKGFLMPVYKLKKSYTAEIVYFLDTSRFLSNELT